MTMTIVIQSNSGELIKNAVSMATDIERENPDTTVNIEVSLSGLIYHK